MKFVFNDYFNYMRALVFSMGSCVKTIKFGLG